MTAAAREMKKQVSFVDELEVFEMPADFRDTSLDELFYSPQEIKKFQDERFEEEALALQLKKEQEAADRKAEKEVKKRQRREKLTARREARKLKKAASTGATPARAAAAATIAKTGKNRLKSKVSKTRDVGMSASSDDSEYWMLSTSASSSSSDSDEVLLRALQQREAHVREAAFLTLDAHSPSKRRHSAPPKFAPKRHSHTSETDEYEDASPHSMSSSSQSAFPASPTKRSPRRRRFRKSCKPDLATGPLAGKGEQDPVELTTKAPAVVVTPQSLASASASAFTSTPSPLPCAVSISPPSPFSEELTGDSDLEALLPTMASTLEVDNSRGYLFQRQRQRQRQRELRGWKLSSFALLVLLVLSWVWFSFAVTDDTNIRTSTANTMETLTTTRRPTFRSKLWGRRTGHYGHLELNRTKWHRKVLSRMRDIHFLIMSKNGQS